MATMVSRTGVWGIGEEDTTLPTLEVSSIETGQVIKLTCQFFARTMTDNLNDGFEYRLEVNGGAVPLSPIMGLVQGSDSWQLYTHIALYEAQSSDKIAFNLTTAESDMNGKGSMMSLLLLAETIELN
ncbi:MAG: hypothetical protein Q9P44_09100 [Anaerolineae bacterium]|nr:hypothetical protein [Anaerolineae bacterium]